MSNTENNFQDIASSVKLREGTLLDKSIGSDPWYVVVWDRFTKHTVAKISFYFIGFMIFVAIFFPILAPYSPSTTQGFFWGNKGGGSNVYPNLRYPMGTDQIGRDILSMLLGGAQFSIMVGIGSTVIFLIIGIPLGLISGYYGGRLEEIIMRMTDFFLALPFLIIAILTVQVLSKKYAGLFSGSVVPIVIMVVLGFFGWGGTTRLVNATTKQTIELEYVSAAIALGASDRRILFRHILPNVLAPIIVVGTLGVGFGILSEAGLTYLGLGSPTDISWGNMISTSQSAITLHPQQALIPGFTIFLIVLAINLMGDALRDALDPRLKE